METPRVWVFFYGTFINPSVCAEANVDLRDTELAWLGGFDIDVAPLATLVPSDRHIVYGIVARMSHAELSKLYSLAWVGSYLPEAVLVETRDHRLVPALVFIKHETQRGQAADDYIDRIVEPGRRYGFPQWYIDRLDGFRPGRREA